MEGVTILSETVTRDMSIFGCIVLICIGVIFLVVGIICIILSIREGAASLVIVSAVIIIAGVAFGAIGMVHLSDKPYTVYKVTIDDDVSFKEFNEKYEIIKQDGLIYEVKEK